MELADLLYRVFHIIFSMEIAAVVLFPVILLLHLLMQNLPKAYSVWEWRLYFLRIFCPVAISSPFAVVSEWNRIYHRLLASLGLTMIPERGVMVGWSSVLQGEIRTTLSYRICAWLWLTGVVAATVFITIRQIRIRGKLKRNAVRLEGKIYQSQEAGVPAQTGIFWIRYYLPEGTGAKEMRYILAHMAAHRKRKSGIWYILGTFVAIVHWFNPLVWLGLHLAKRDDEMACDEKVLRDLQREEQKQYAQAVLNLQKREQRLPYTVSTIYEAGLESRSARILYWRKAGQAQRLAGMLILTLTLVFWFFLRPMQIAWAGGTWGNGRAEEERLFSGEDLDEVLAETNTVSPNGLSRIVQLVMIKGKKENNSYNGSFSVRMKDSLGNEIAELNMEEIFRKDGDFVEESSGREFHFTEGLTLQLGDYNADGAQEMLIGQQNVFYVVNVGEDVLSVISEEVYIEGDDLPETVVPGTEEGMDDLFYVNASKGRDYYVWNSEEGKYFRQELTQEELNQHKAVSRGDQTAGVTEDHTLQDAEGNAVIRVTTKTDTTGSPAIQSVIVDPEGRHKKMKPVRGYYCDLKWVNQKDGTAGRYVVLTYNGTRAQTFVIYDVKEKEIYYRHEDGNAMLKELFQRYNGTEIVFENGGAVVYNLLELNQGILKISFAANADGGVMVSGNYRYHIDDETTTDLSFAQSVEN